jgi:hypothetical protein
MAMKRYSPEQIIVMLGRRIEASRVTGKQARTAKSKGWEQLL